MMTIRKILGIEKELTRYGDVQLILSPELEIKSNVKDLGCLNLTNSVITELVDENLSNMDLHGSIITVDDLYINYSRDSCAVLSTFNGTDLKGTVFIGNLSNCSFKGTYLKETVFMKYEHRNTDESIIHCDMRYATEYNIREYTHKGSISLNPRKGVFGNKLIPNEMLIEKYSLLDIHPKVSINKGIIDSNIKDPTFGPLAAALSPLADEETERRLKIDYFRDGSNQINSIEISGENRSRLALLPVIVGGYENISTHEQRELLMVFKCILENDYANKVFKDHDIISDIVDAGFYRDPYGAYGWDFSIACKKYMSIESNRQAHNWGFYMAIVDGGPYTAIKR